MTPAERVFARAIHKYTKSLEDLAQAQQNYTTAARAVLAERGLQNAPLFGLNRHYGLERNVYRKAAQNIQSAARAAATRRRTAFAGTQLAQSLPKNLMLKILRRN